MDDRPQDIAYFGFQGMLDATETVDNRINQEPLSLHYSLKLPQAIYNPETKTVEEIFSSPGKRDREMITQGMSRLFETPGMRLDFDNLTNRNGNDEGKEDDERNEEQQEEPRARETSEYITSPKMSRLLNSGEKGGNDNRIGYYGPLTFFLG